MLRAADRLKGMGIGSLFLALFGGLWMVAALNTLSWVWLVACDFVPASLLAVRAISMIVSSHELAALEPEPSPSEQQRARRMGRRFGLVVAVEFGLIALAANLLAARGQAAWTLAAIAFIVGVHFIPLARIYRFRLYYWTGAVELALCALISALMRQRIQMADPLFGLAMGVSLWVTVVFVLAQGGRLFAIARAEAAAPKS